jgi:hypothetical protein
MKSHEEILQRQKNMKPHKEAANKHEISWGNLIGFKKHENSLGNLMKSQFSWNHNSMSSYRLTLIHSGDCGNVPLIEVSVEGGSRTKHCRKKRRPITFTVNAQEKKAEESCDSPKKANIFIHHHHPNPRLKPPITIVCVHVTSSQSPLYVLTY